MRKTGFYGLLLVMGIFMIGTASPAADGDESGSFYLALRGGPGWADRADRHPESGSGAKLKFESE